MQISPEAIYQYIYVLPRGELKQTLVKALRQEHKYRRAQKGGKTEENRGKIADMLSIEERPAEVADRSVPGHWEGDLSSWVNINALRWERWSSAPPAIQFWFRWAIKKMLTALGKLMRKLLKQSLMN